MTGAGDHCRTHSWAYRVRIHRSRVMALDSLAVADYSWSHLAHPAVQPRNLCTHNPCYARAASSQGKRQPQHFCTDRARASWSEADDHYRSDQTGGDVLHRSNRAMQLPIPVLRVRNFSTCISRLTQLFSVGFTPSTLVKLD